MNRPALTELIDPGPFSEDGTQMLFCGGHTFLGTGDLLWVGGTDGDMMCQDACVGSTSFYGNPYAWRLDTRSDVPVWIPEGQMPYARWYPTATLLDGGETMVSGHIQAPFFGQDTKRDLFLGAGQWTSAFNYLPGSPACDPPSADPLGMLDYPRLHVLSSGYVIQTNPNSGDVVMPILAPTRYLDLTFTQPCPTDPRWEEGPAPSTIRFNGGSVHVIGYDETTDQFREAVYAVGGSTVEFEGLPCQCDEDPAKILDSVEKLVPGAGHPSGWTWDASPADLNHARVNHNTVILADGSILVVAGEATDGSNCVPRFVAERYRPPEIFPNAPNGWEEMSSQIADRRYHSTAGLLADGRVFSAGGANLNHVDNPEGPKNGTLPCDDGFPPAPVGTDPNAPWDLPDHSIEVYSPPYVFRVRPEIDQTTLNDFVTDPYEYGGFMQFTVDRAPGTVIKRVAVIRSAAATHAFDMSQRYVELKIVTNVAGATDGRASSVRRHTAGRALRS